MGTQTLAAPTNGPFAPRIRPTLGHVPGLVPSSVPTGLYRGATRPTPGTAPTRPAPMPGVEGTGRAPAPGLPPSPAAEPEHGDKGRRWSRTPSIRRPSPGIVPLGSAVPVAVGVCDESADQAGEHTVVRPAGYRMGRWARLAVTTTVLVAAALLTVSLLSGQAPRRMVDVTVGPGDTLWSIATVQAPDRDPRAVISEIEQLNGLDSSVLQVGVVLRVPAEGG